MLSVVTTAILPIILNVAVGFVLAKRQFLDHAMVTRFSGLTFRFFIPCLLFASSYRADITLLRLAQYWSGYFLPLLLLFALLALLSRPLVALTTVYANTVMVGIPLVVQRWGDAGLNIAVAVISLNSLTFFLTYALFSTIGGRGGLRGRMARDLGSTLTNPIILSLVVGVALNLLQIPISRPLIEAVALPRRAALPCALLILGATLATMPLRVRGNARARLVLICLCKLLLIPALVYLFADRVLYLTPMTTGVLVLLAACPCGINVLPFAQKSNRDRQMVSAAILLSTVASVVTLPVWVYWVQ